MDVAQEAGQILALLHRLVLIAVTEKMAPELVSGIEAVRPGVLKPTHSLHHVRFRGLEEQMVVLAHEHPGIEVPPASLYNFLQGTFEALAIEVVMHDVLPAVATGHGMRDGAGILDALLSRHFQRAEGMERMSICYD